MNKIKKTLKLSCVKVGEFSLNLWNRLMDPLFSIYFLFEVFIFKNV
jgi:hypothetical protein